MYQIKHVINYDKEALDLELEKDMERFYKDKRIPRLMLRSMWLRHSRTIASRTGLACSLCALILAIQGELATLSRILALSGLSLSLLSLFVLSSAVPKVLQANKQKLVEILDTYGDTLAMRYHMFLVRNGAENLEIWGVETKDSKFEVTLSKTVDGRPVKDTLICDFDEQNPDGALVLDVQNGVVLRVTLANEQ